MKNKRLIALLLSATLTACCIFSAFPTTIFAQDASGSQGELIADSDIPLRLYYDEEASHGVAAGYDDVSESFGSSSNLIGAHVDDDWERWSIPLGNGYFGANIFGRTESERIQLTEKTLANPFPEGVNNFSETYIDFGHTNSSVTSYSRTLDIREAVSQVSYVYNGVTYTREYFTSYPDNVMVIKLDASSTGALNFTLRPTIPYEQSYMNTSGDGKGKSGTVTSSVSQDGIGTIILSGTLEYFDTDFAGIYTVVTDGTGTVNAGSATNENGETDGTITVSGAKSAYILINIGTDYVLSEETFSQPTASKPTTSTTVEDAIAEVTAYRDAVVALTDGMSYDAGYELLKERHIADYTELFGRVSLNLNCKESDFALTTDVLLENYKNGSQSSYLEVLYFQYGRYLLIASSRKGALPANLQGTWNRYNKAPWSSGYWHNINVQMNYWPAFSTNLAETFESYVDYNAAYMPAAQVGATSKIEQLNPDVSGTDGGNGWSIDTGAYPYTVYGSTSIGNLGFTTQLFWEYYLYTGDEQLLSEVVYPVLVGAARFITKAVKQDADGNYLAIYTDSPEQYVNGEWYYTTGTTYAQTFAYINNYNTLVAAKTLGIDLEDDALLATEEYSILATVLEQIDKYDPIIVGLSGQIKEFREEEYYGDLGEKTHRHISQLVGLYPGNLINGTTPAWLDAAEYTLTQRGDIATGWGVAHRLNLWARVQNGERAYDLYEQLLKANTATNLWDLHPPFQIDGNLGGTAGVAEMLLQSHAGYIEPLAAIPEQWSDGTYTGLMARGNFEVSAKWADGLASCFNVTSLNGGEVSVKYSGIAKATLTDESGNAINYTVTDKDIITFDTEAGKTYIIAGFTKNAVPEKVASLTVSGDGIYNAELSWSTSSSAVSYNVYVAKDSDADYTFLANTRKTTYTYTPTSLENPRLTFAVTAVSEAGVESGRTLAYINPTETVINQVGVKVSDDAAQLQVTIDASQYAAKFRLYSKEFGSEGWTLVEESGYPVIVDDTFSTARTYAVSVIDYFGNETEIRTITTAKGTNVDIDYDAENALKGVQFVPTEEANAWINNTTYGYQTLTDGNFIYNVGRFSTKTNDAALFDATATFGATFILSELRIHSFNDNNSNMGADLLIQVLSEGNWITVYNLETNDDIVAHKSSTGYFSFDMNLVKAEAIRIYSSKPVSGNSISYEEIECSALLSPSPYVYEDDLLDGLKFVPTAEADKMVHQYGNQTEYEKYNYDRLTDKNYIYNEGRFSTKTNDEAFVDATVELGTTALLSKLRMHSFNHTDENIGGDMLIQTRLGGVWTTVYDLGSNAEILPYKNATDYFEFDLGYVSADAVRIYVSKPVSGKSISWEEIQLDGYLSPATYVTVDNLLADKTFTPTQEAMAEVHNRDQDGYGYIKLTDGDFAWNTGRFSTYSRSTAIFDATIELGATYKLSEIKMYTFNNLDQYIGSYMEIQVRYGGVWTTVYTYTTNEDIIAHKTDSKYYGFNMGGVSADAIRIYIKDPVPNGTAYNSISFNEIECSGMLVKMENYSPEIPDSNILLGTTEDKVTIDKTLHTSTAKSPEVLFDGATSDESNAARIAVLGSGGFEIEIELPQEKALYELRIYDWRGVETVTRSDKTNVYVYTKDGWFNVIFNKAMTTENPYASFDLGGIRGSKIRITFENTVTPVNVATIKELTLSVGDDQLLGNFIDKSELLDAYKELAALDTSNNAPLDTAKEKALALFVSKLTDWEATQSEIDTYTAEIDGFKESIISGTGENITAVIGHSCTFENDISVNYYVTQESLDGCEGTFIVIERETYVDGVLTTVTEIIDEYTISGGNLRFVYEGIAACEMGDKLYSTVYTIKDGALCIGERNEYSVKEYAYNRLAQSESAEFKTLLVDMLNYGAAAQVYFGYDTDNLVNADLTDEQRALATVSVTPESISGTESEVENETVTLVGQSVVFNSNVELKYYMRFSEETNINNLVLVLTYTTIGGIDEIVEIRGDEFEYVAAYNAYGAKCASIAAADMSCAVRATVYDGGTAVSDTSVYSIESYVANRLAASANDEFKSLISEMYKYSESAKAYFEGL